MADKPAGDPTEEATDEQIRSSREEGKIPQSKEVPSAFMVAMLLVLLCILAEPLLDWFTMQARRGVQFEYPGTMNHEAFRDCILFNAKEALVAIIPFLIAGVLVSLSASLIVGGWAFSPKAAQVKMERISPVKGLKNLLSSRSLVNLLTSILKMVVIGWIVWMFVRDKMPGLLALRWTTPEGMVAMTAELVYGVVLRITLALVVIAGADLMWQKWKYKRELRMTRQQVKEERKRFEASPELKGRIRTVQMEMARKRMMGDVAGADVVVTNPTHVAVALVYDADTMGAPEVVAKGPDVLAQKIKTIARENDVPIIHRPEVARALYASTEPGQPVPEEMFVAVAEILAMVYRMENRTQRRQSQTV